MVLRLVRGKWPCLHKSEDPHRKHEGASQECWSGRKVNLYLCVLLVPMSKDYICMPHFLRYDS